MEKNKNVPKLRFPEFTGEWEEKKLGEITEKIIYGMNAAATSYDGQNKYLRITDIDESSRSFTPKPLTSPDGLIEDKYRLSEGDLVFARTGASVGKSYLYNKSDGNLYFAGFLIRFTILNENPYFIYAQTLKESFNKWVQLMSMRSGQPGINAEEYKTLPIFLPSFPEQTKIESFLTAVDEKLTQLKKKKTLLEQYKKGIMQKLFSQELRFKDNNNQDFPDWQEKTLGEISDVRDGTHESPQYYDYGFPFITSKNLLKDGNIDFDNVSYINEHDFNRFNFRSKVDVNDILFAMIGTIGNPVLVSKDGFAIKNVALIKEKGNLLNIFLIHYMKGPSINQQFFEQNTGGTQKFLSLSVIKNLIVAVPSLPEQQKIATFLSSIDEKISHSSAQIEKMETWKKGLLQQMFV
ncbi:MAG: restriction endonuclease subunit S [Parabacteroides sp.]|nr:restriction endonuclease subunit S [Parabacteroides sp.]